MEKNKKYIRKSFLVHQYDKVEAFLSKMAQDGWQFVKLHHGLPTRYEFVKGEKMDFIYQLDFVTKEEDTPNYHQLFADSGWDEVYKWPGFGGIWYYFRMIRSNDSNKRIYSDIDSKYQMYEKLWKKSGVFFVFFMFLEIFLAYQVTKFFKDIDLSSVFGILLILSCCVCAFAAIMYGYWAVALVITKNRIKKSLKLKF